MTDSAAAVVALSSFPLSLSLSLPLHDRCPNAAAEPSGADGEERKEGRKEGARGQLSVGRSLNRRRRSVSPFPGRPDGRG